MFIFGHQVVIEFEICSCVRNFMKSDDFSLRYGDFTIFKMADLRHLKFLESSNGFFEKLPWPWDFL